MPRKKSSLSKRYAHHTSNGHTVPKFKAGPFMTLSSDPKQCYIIGNSFPTGQVLETLAMNQWARGTRFTTRVGGQLLEYEVDYTTFRLINQKSLGS